MAKNVPEIRHVIEECTDTKSGYNISGWWKAQCSPSETSSKLKLKQGVHVLLGSYLNVPGDQEGAFTKLLSQYDFVVIEVRNLFFQGSQWLDLKPRC